MENHSKMHRKKYKNKKTRTVTFGNAKGLQITSNKWIKSIQDKVYDYGSFNIKSKYYEFLNKKNITQLISKNLLFSINTYGKRMLLFLVKFNHKNYSIFINNKTGKMILSRFRFVDELFNGTLLMGEFIKHNDDDKWSYIVNDICYYCGKNIVTEPFTNRLKILEELLSTKFQNDENLSICNVELKKYYELCYLDYVTKNKDTLFNYKVSGLYFKNIDNFSNNYLYIFLSSRSDVRVKKNKEERIEEMSNHLINKIPVRLDKNPTSKKSKQQSKKYSKQNSKYNIKIDRNYVILNISRTSLPDIYELYHLNKNNLELNSCASIPNKKISNYLRKIFKKKDVSDYNEDLSSESELSEDEECNKYKIKCYYHDLFKKWVPYELVNNDTDIDNIKYINNFIYSR